MPKVKDSGFRERTNEERKEEIRDRRYHDMNHEDYGYEKKHFQTASDTWRKKMLSDERKAVESYTGSGYRAMNSYLRHGNMGSGDDPAMEEKILNAENGIAKFKLSENMTVYRKSSSALLADLGVYYSEFSHNVEGFVADMKARIGSIVRDKGFTSTSTRRSTWSGDVQYIIRVPKGTSCAYVEHISQHPSEREMILNRGTNFKVVSARVEHDVPVIELQVVRK